MPTNGMTIDSLNTISSLTAQDEVPVWDKEASGEPTRKITAQNMANSVKSLASLPNTTEMNTAIDQSTADVIRTGDVVNSLTSTATDKPLSANMGKTLNDKFDNRFGNIQLIEPLQDAWPASSVTYNIQPYNRALYMFNASGGDNNGVCAIYVIRNDGTVYLQNITVSKTVSVTYSNGVVTVTLPSYAYWQTSLIQIN